MACVDNICITPFGVFQFFLQGLLTFCWPMSKLPHNFILIFNSLMYSLSHLRRSNLKLVRIFIQVLAKCAEHVTNAFLHVHSAFYQLIQTGNFAEPKTLSWDKLVYCNFSSSNFTLKDHIISMWPCKNIFHIQVSLWTLLQPRP
jgi:hypothetical protein